LIPHAGPSLDGAASHRAPFGLTAEVFLRVAANSAEPVSRSHLTPSDPEPGTPVTSPQSPSADGPSSPAIAHRRLTVAVCLAMVSFSTAITVPSVCLERLGDEFSLDLTTRGLLGSLRMGVLVLSLLVAGAFADRFGKRPFLGWGMALIGVGMAATAGASDYRALFVAQALVGAGCGTLEALLNPLIAELNPRNAARALNVINGLFSVGVLLGAVLTGEMLAGGVSWRVAFLVWPALALVGAGLLAGGGYPPAAGSQQAGEDAVTDGLGRYAFLRSPVFWALMVAMFLGGGSEFAMTGWGANYVERELEATARGGGWSIAFYGLFMALGRLAVGGLVTRVSATRLMLVSAIGGATVTGVLCGVHNLLAAWAMLALGGLFIACFWPTLIAVAAERIEQHSSALFALLAASGIAGSTVFSWAIGALGDLAGLRVGMGLLPVSMAVLGAVIWWLERAIARK